MDKLLTNKGGQPLFLEDLQLLQDTEFGIMAGMITAMAGQEPGAFLLEAPRMTSAIGDEPTVDDRGYATVQGVTTTITAGAIVHNGNIINFDTATFDNLDVANANIWVVIKKRQTDMRDLKNGQIRPCREEYKAQLQAGKPTDAEAAYSLFDLETISEVLARRIGTDTPDTRYRQMPVVFYNGFTGSVRCSYGVKRKLKVDVRSSNKEWRKSDKGYPEDQYTGLIGIMLGDRSLDFLTMITPDTTAYVPLRPDGAAFEPGIIPDGTLTIRSFVETTSPRGKIVIQNVGFYSDENGKIQGVNRRGYLPPCLDNDEYGRIEAVLEEGDNDSYQ